MGEAGPPGTGPGPWVRAVAPGVWLAYLLYPISQFAAHPVSPRTVPWSADRFRSPMPVGWRGPGF